MLELEEHKASERERCAVNEWRVLDYKLLPVSLTHQSSASSSKRGSRGSLKNEKHKWKV